MDARLDGRVHLRRLIGRCQEWCYCTRAQLTNKAIRRGAFALVPDLIAKIDAYLTANNANPRPPTKSWKKSSGDA